MINFDLLNGKVEELKSQFLNAQPFEHVVIDNFCDENLLLEAVAAIPAVKEGEVNKSRDFIFAKNKFEKALFDDIHPNLKTLKRELLADEFKELLCKITGENIFIDPNFHGGGLHQGGKDSFLDMHVDFNYHPNEPSWFRNVNILLYLNKDWKKDYGGELKLLDGRVEDANLHLIEPLFNRAVIMFTRDYTLHGYAPIKFPDGEYRRSIAAYGYTQQDHEGVVRTTVWYPEKGGFLRKLLGKHMPRLVKLKSKLIGSGTSKNK
ncbi:2OG-Fe(II) oxygenase [Psychrosphaera aestuarii]|uniref:2OG-Fe(II) oxygenase n=1 Tax=Psychrosphaera aestuarii TaxID=1266052 RepID=UPI001B342758|nr:2OG-Fe(II) oxygenase [Psychrosphaera aestuarii]